MTKCQKCDNYSLFRDDGLCFYCSLINSTAPWVSNRVVRCPSCGDHYDALQFMQHITWDDTPNKYAEYPGQLSIKCYCGHEYTVACEMSFLFTSPAKVGHEYETPEGQEGLPEQSAETA